ncbi:unnamed protein product [Peniophora sp. CBMAI 1063]|nr:unnamed protein product [Peniophora sp. CBMAI 1063]
MRKPTNGLSRPTRKLWRDGILDLDRELSGFFCAITGMLERKLLDGVVPSLFAIPSRGYATHANPTKIQDYTVVVGSRPWSIRLCRKSEWPCRPVSVPLLEKIFAQGQGFATSKDV